MRARAIHNAPLPRGHSARRTLALDGNALDSGGSLWRTLSRRACCGRAVGGSLRRTRSRRACGGRQPHALLAVGVRVASSLRRRKRTVQGSRGRWGRCQYCWQTRPLARPPKGTQKKSLDAAVA